MKKYSQWCLAVIGLLSVCVGETSATSAMSSCSEVGYSPYGPYYADCTYYERYQNAYHICGPGRYDQQTGKWSFEITWRCDFALRNDAPRDCGGFEEAKPEAVSCWPWGITYGTRTNRWEVRVIEEDAAFRACLENRDLPREADTFCENETAPDYSREYRCCYPIDFFSHLP